MYQVIAGNIFCNFLCLSSCLGKTKLWGGHSSFLRMEFKIMMQFPSFARTKTLRKLMEISLTKNALKGIEY